ncbi:hypothetical protein [Aneurinibacillus danicus]|jgi:hypothetical protein|uniref:Uncharacterized protein n=1 Tax=Aneurinibacillus danicus TaxID=267746 RepID=A0A511VCZ7_9BACL|nr:hypothetical protein [Aneurinibacillus danicus]GEN36770.1 hypothetical protein ADA01nite_42300 [Aneurinibacillus danicus]
MKKEMDIKGKKRTDLFTPTNQRCYPITHKITEKLQEIIKMLVTYEGRINFLKEIYISLHRLEEYITTLQELALQEKEGQRLVYYYVTIAQDIRSAVVQLRYLLRTSALPHKIEAQIAILHALNRKLLHAIDTAI